jgi:hypothetical protein
MGSRPRLNTHLFELNLTTTTNSSQAHASRLIFMDYDAKYRVGSIKKRKIWAMI